MIFISYARSDGTDHAARLDTDLTHLGYKTWRDKRSIDYYQDFSGEIEKAIRAADYVAVVVTPSVELNPQSFVRREIIYAQSKEKPIIPLIFPQATPPTLINHLTWIPFFTGKKLADHKLTYTDGLSALLSRLKEQPLSEARHNEDPFTDYLRNLYDWLNGQLESRVFSLITLSATDFPEAVALNHPLARARNDRLMSAPLFPEKVQHLPTAHVKNIQQVFENYYKRILLLGEPGTGKTVTTLAFARNAVAARLTDSSKPLPIFALIATWDADQQTSLPDWLAEPGLNQSMIEELISRGEALLILDGLDELGENRWVDPDDVQKGSFDPRLRFIKHLNESAPKTPILISCRSKEYSNIEENLRLEGAIKLNPLELEDIKYHLAELPQLLDAIENDKQLKEIIVTPLILSLFTYAYSHMTLEERDQLTKLDNSLILRNKIFEAFIQNAYEREASRPKIPVPFDYAEFTQRMSLLAVDNLDEIGRGEKLLTVEDINRLFPLDNPVILGDFASKLYILLFINDSTYRFSHQQLRDSLALKHVLQQIHNLDINNELDEAYIIRPLRYILQHESTGIRKGLIDILIEVNHPDIVPLLVDALNDDDPYIRLNATIELGKRTDPRATFALINNLGDSQLKVRYETAVALENIGKPAVIPLIETLNNSNAEVRYEIVDILDKLKDSRAIDPLIKVILNDRNLDVLRRVLDTFLGLDNLEVIYRLIGILENPDNVIDNPSNDTIELLKKEDLQKKAAIALGKSNNPDAIQSLINFLYDSEGNIRYFVAETLATIEDMHVIFVLIEILRNPTLDQSTGDFIVSRLAKYIHIPEAVTAANEWFSLPDSLEDAHLIQELDSEEIEEEKLVNGNQFNSQKLMKSSIIPIVDE